MAQYIDKFAIVAEIEKLKDEAEIYPSDFYCGRLSICKELMNFLDIPEVKVMDLEKEFDEYTKHITAQDVKDEPFTRLFACAKHFFELGLQTKKNSYEIH